MRFNLLISSLIVGAACCAAAAEPDPAFTIPSKRWLIGGQVDGEAVVQFAPASERSRAFTLTCTCQRDGDRLDSLTVRYEGGSPVRAWRSIVNGYYVSYQEPPRGKFAPGGYFAADGSLMAGAALPSCLAPFQGYFAGDYLNLSEIKKKAPHLALSETTVDGVTCQTVTLDSPEFGRYQVSYDPSVGHLPRAAEVRKSGQHWVGPQRLADGPPRTPLGSKGPTPVIELVYTLDQVKFELTQGQWFPLSCRVTRVLRYADGNSETTTMRWSRTGLRLDPVVGAEAFMPRLREGAHLVNLVQPQLAMQWKSGAAVPLVDPQLVRQMDAAADSLRHERQHPTAGVR